MNLLNKKLRETKPAKYQCPECGLHYEDEATMRKCEAWCKEYKSCNLEIMKESIESRRLS